MVSVRKQAAFIIQSTLAIRERGEQIREGENIEQEEDEYMQLDMNLEERLGKQDVWVDVDWYLNAWVNKHVHDV
jgi:hypothetical protein